MNDWPVVRIKDLGRVVTGKTPPTEAREYFDGDDLFISPKDLSWDQYYVTETETRISEKAFAKFKNQVLPSNAVLFTSLSFAFGKMGLTSRRSLTNQQINSIVVSDAHDYKFVFYLLKAYRPIIFSYNSGIDTPIVPKSVFEDIQVTCPPLETQQKIAAILSTYDDLIANNQRRITLLERMAEDIYREWFVRLRFPGHEDVKLDRGLPQGWRVAELGEIFKTSSGGTPARDDPSNFGGDISWIKTGELKSTFAIGSEESITQRGIENSPAKVYPKHTVVMAMYCAMPDLSITANDAATNQACCAFLPKNSSFHHSYCYFLVKFAQLQLVMFAHGAAQQNLSQEIIKKFPVVLPLEPLILAFGEKAAPIFDSIETLMRVNKELASTRDALLPRLISGKLSVDALDIRFPPGMAGVDA